MKIATSSHYSRGWAKPSKRHIGIALSVFSASVLIAVLAIFYSASAVTQNTVRPSDVRPISEVAAGPTGWYETEVGTGTVELTTDKPANVAGSAEFTVADSGSYAELGLYKNFGTQRLADIQNISYATWQDVDDTKAVSLQLNLDRNVTDGDTSWQGRLVYEPYMNQAFSTNGVTTPAPVTDGVWQTWMVTNPDSQVWMTATTNNPCPQSNPCSYSEFLGIYPNAGFNPGTGSPLILKAGSGWTSFNGYADLVAVGENYWDFEPAAPTGPATKEDCFKGGWQTYGATFKNQGACVSSVARQQ